MVLFFFEIQGPPRSLDVQDQTTLPGLGLPGRITAHLWPLEWSREGMQMEKREGKGRAEKRGSLLTFLCDRAPPAASARLDARQHTGLTLLPVAGSTLNRNLDQTGCGGGGGLPRERTTVRRR